MINKLNVRITRVVLSYVYTYTNIHVLLKLFAYRTEVVTMLCQFGVCCVLCFVH